LPVSGRGTNASVRVLSNLFSARALAARRIAVAAPHAVDHQIIDLIRFGMQKHHSAVSAAAI